MAGISITYCPPPPDSSDACITVIAPRETEEFPVYISRAAVGTRGTMLAVDLRDCPNLWEPSELTALAEVLELARMFPEVPHTRVSRSWPSK